MTHEKDLGNGVNKEARFTRIGEVPAKGYLGVEVGNGGDGGDGSEHQPDNYNPDFHPSAKIWSLYLKEASDLAKAQTELWKTGLESLLLFAGLFAGVVSAFLIESRKKLRMDDQELLIRKIHNTQLGMEPKEDDYQPSMDDLWINGLWFSSLLITLFSAIVGVLAKSWLVKYAPLAAGEDSKEAYRRRRLELSVKNWHMEWVFTMVPLFVQFAFFLFAVGFAIQCHNDHQALGYTVSTIVGLGFLVYLLVTALPLLPGVLCPFQTPLSEILMQLQRLMRGGAEAATPEVDKVDFHRVLGEIWDKELIDSPKQDFVDEAIAEIGRRTLSDERIKSFADSNAPMTVLEGLERCMTSEYQEDPRRNEIISNHLLALSRFIDYSISTDHKHIDLKSKLVGSLGSKSPLGRWNFFTEPTLPLAFSIRVPLLLAFNEDIAITEVSEQPWEQLARAVKPKYRLRFLLSSCRALATGRENLRKVSSLSLAACMSLAIKSGLKSEWGGESPDKTEAMKLVRWCILRVCNEIAHSWKGEALEYWMAYLSTGTIDETQHGVQSSGFPRSLDAALKNSKTIYRRQAVSIILSMADPQRSRSHMRLPPT
ncbi:hypothetical protein BKA70DRAFT_736057 [Coprinopsis sp. MPI-PUGE-AT-0042]|nr:hypothetical protein BKA70DRAFT_736057 [Coprinopsis sp. MPI-PUGE-AT-0042]